ncbi:Nitric oxide reductase FlRd-NAD(+) reductase [Nocardiopsis dassonvillei]|uniref:NAD(P)/FAD-dependent oxidoreductase n=1 Tax=Nocardiopsis dassonvillei TaxID=2014 RepID=UPI003F562ECB
MATHTRVVVIGGGYSGVLAANRLTQRTDLSITLVNPRPAFVDRIRLHQLAAGTHEAVVDYADVLSPAVHLVIDTATLIDPEARTVSLASGDTLGYDHLVYAVGSTSALPDGVTGAAEFAHPLAGLEEARALKEALASVAPTAPVTVVGAGPTGIEAAAELAEATGHPVTLVCGGLLNPYLHPRGRRAVARRLEALGVTVVDGPGSRVTAVAADSVRLDDGRELPGAVTVWAAGFSVPQLARHSGLSTDEEGRLLTDETLTSVDGPYIVATGDAAAPSGLPVRMSCQAAVQSGPQAADTVLARIAGHDPRPLSVLFAAQCISLGRRTGILQLAHRNDIARGAHLSGVVGGKIKEYICRGIIGQLSDEARRPGRRRVRFTDGGHRERLLRERTAADAPLKG